MADTAIQNPAIAGVLKRPFAEQVAFFRAKLGDLVPTAVWTDMLRAAHDRGFMVAGAQSADLLADLAAAVDRAVTEGVGIDTFRKDFRAAVAKAGWAYNGEFNWRTRTIYRTNIATSYAAGRLAQLRAGGFTHYLYKHGDSIEPRAQHLAWDGLVLPADHEFWRAHYPPNGWGCSCRVIGLRRLEDAAALGGDPAKQLPDNWDAIDPKTGAPVGIGKGWDYAPGDTVSDSVAQMAAKTQQWDYTLAKSYMQNVPTSVRDALAQAYRALPSVATDTRLYAQKILESESQPANVPVYRTLGLLTHAQAADVMRKVGHDVTGFDFAVGRDAPIHVRNHHGDEVAEGLRGQRAITAKDYAQLPRIADAPDEVRDDGVAGTGRPVVRFIKVIGGEKYIAAFEIRTGRKMLSLQSLRVGKP